MSETVRLEELPVAVRTRVLTLVADVLPDVPQLPAALRKVAGFAPARRARLGGQAITAGLADEDLRARIAHQVSVRRQDELVALRDGTMHDALEAAALDWLVRPQGWTRRLDTSVSQVEEHAAQQQAVVAQAKEERWQQRAEQAEAELRDLRASYRQQVEGYKAEVSQLRRKLGEARAKRRDVDEETLAAAHAAEEARAAAEVALAARDKEVRRLHAEVERLEAEARQGRRGGRAEKEQATARTRVLLDTILDATAGLRRELALPPATSSPGERVEESLAAPDVPGPRAVPDVGPALLEQYLALPRARLVVDGYNVSMGAWSGSSLEAQRTRLLTAMAPLVARTGAETTVVFDGADADTRPPTSQPRGVKVLFSPKGVIADEVIGQLVEAEPRGRVVLVVSDDREVQARCQRAGARAVASASLVGLLGG
ncbi:NYN domain-containing protein [uncultured Nocardioides sp.]|uniref:NYN domain-containing protein n=1 Tax=uncultured Nocardioides sp. TaxID=198441 RepID=UPI000C6AC0B2|nr:RNA-binding protein [Nocardioides sp.]